MNKMMVALAGFTACAGMVFAQSAADISAAAADAGKIPEIVKNLKSGTAASFAADVMSAVAGMSVSPARKIKQLASVSDAFLGTVAPDKSEDLVEKLVVSVVPYKLQPEWIRLFKPAVDAFYEKVADENYKNIVAGVLSRIDSDKAVEAKDKYVVTCFALLLLSRGDTAEDKDGWLTFQTIPASCKDQVVPVMPDVFRGNYDALLGGEKLNFVRPVTRDDVIREGQEGLVDESDVTRVGRPAPLTYRTTGKGTDKKPPKKNKPKPAPEYKAQF